MDKQMATEAESDPNKSDGTLEKTHSSPNCPSPRSPDLNKTTSTSTRATSGNSTRSSSNRRDDNSTQERPLDDKPDTQELVAETVTHSMNFTFRQPNHSSTLLPPVPPEQVANPLFPGPKVMTFQDFVNAVDNGPAKNNPQNKVREESDGNDDLVLSSSESSEEDIDF